jgi:hypothetical protein
MVHEVDRRAQVRDQSGDGRQKYARLCEFQNRAICTFRPRADKIFQIGHWANSATDRIVWFEEMCLVRRRCRKIPTYAQFVTSNTSAFSGKCFVPLDPPGHEDIATMQGMSAYSST